MNGSDTVRRNDGLLTTEVDGELLAMSIDQGACYGLNPIGTTIWKLIEQPQTVDQICAALVQEFEVSDDDCRREVGAFLEQMRDEAMVTVTPAA